MKHSYDIQDPNGDKVLNHLDFMFAKNLHFFSKHV